MKRVYVFLLLLIAFVVINNQPTKALVTDLAPYAKSALLMEAQTGVVMFKKEEAKKLPPASMTKIASAIIICEKIVKGELTYDQMITTSAYAKSQEGSRAFLDTGEQLSVDEMLKCILIASANDATVAMAEAIAGTEAEFVKMMNEKARELGCENTLFSDSTGLASSNHYTTAYDMALLAKELINNYGHIVLKYTSTYDDYIRKDTPNKFWLVNTNKLIGKIEGLDGLKTGWTSEAGYCLTATMTKGDMRLISVVMGEDSPLIRNAETVAMLNYGFANYERKVILEKGKVINFLTDIRYNPKQANFVLYDDIAIIIKRGEALKEVRFEVVKEAKAYDFRGMIKVYYGDTELGEFAYGSEIEIKQRSFVELLVELLKMIFIT